MSVFIFHFMIIERTHQLRILKEMGANLFCAGRKRNIYIYDQSQEIYIYMTKEHIYMYDQEIYVCVYISTYRYIYDESLEAWC